MVELYLAGGEPVASAAVARASSTGLSAASIRNVMSDLEEAGYLMQPHTSAGRVPTDRGFRVYLNGQLAHVVLPPVEERRLRAMLTGSGPLEESLAQVSHVLAEVTSEVGVAVAPHSQDASLRSIHFVQVSSERVLAIVVTAGGLVDSRLLSVERAFSQAELERISNYCTRSFTGLPLSQIRSRLLVMMAEERGKCDELLAGVVALGQQAVMADVGGEVFLEGAGRLYERAAPGQLEAVRRLFAAFSEKAALLTLLNQLFQDGGPRVALGSELALTGDGDVGLIVTSFQCGSGERGLVGVIGLKRMDYPRIIPIVGFMGAYLSEVGGCSGGMG